MAEEDLSPARRPEAEEKPLNAFSRSLLDLRTASVFSPRAWSLPLYTSRSARNRSMSLLVWANAMRCFSMSFQSCAFWEERLLRSERAWWRAARWGLGECACAARRDSMETGCVEDATGGCGGWAGR